MSPMKPEEIRQRLAALGFMRQPHRNGYRILSWRADEMFPSPVKSTLAAKRACLRSLGLDPEADLPALDQALALLPEAPTTAEISRRDADGFRRQLTTAELCAYKRSGVLPITKKQLNDTVVALARLDRPAAVAILADVGDGALNTVKLKPELWQPVFEACEAARKKIEARAKP
jgi:hypothetical protein